MAEETTPAQLAADWVTTERATRRHVRRDLKPRVLRSSNAQVAGVEAGRHGRTACGEDALDQVALVQHYRGRGRSAPQITDLPVCRHCERVAVSGG